jgi:erythronate-4-phosphate dehydrogenase
MKILADATLPHLDELFSTSFQLIRYHTQDELVTHLPDSDLLLCRSTLKVNAHLLMHSTIQCVATASSGVDHIDADYLAKRGIQQLDAKGCNAEAVTDYVQSTVTWLKANHLIQGYSAGIIGAGEVGRCVAQRLRAMNFDVIQYDPLKAHLDPHFQSCTLAALTACNLLSIHANLHDTQPFPSRDLLNPSFLSQLQPHSILINAARGGIVNEDALLHSKQPLTYCTDVYLNEPHVDPRIIDYATLCTPHIAGHSIEAKLRAVEQISRALHLQHHLSPPKFSLLSQPNDPCASSFQPLTPDQILHCYNPCIETVAFKAAPNKDAAFLNLRQAHTHRHDFSRYANTTLLTNKKE